MRYAVVEMGEPISISEAKTQLSRLVAAAERGEEVTIRRGRKPVVKLVAIDPAPPATRSSFGVLKGKIWISDDFDELGPEWDPYL
jgi:prevent-host-death family protein